MQPGSRGGAGGEGGEAGERVVVAIDGPAGSGKSTVARELARRLGLGYVDTGAMYRALTWAALAESVPTDDPAALGALARRLDLELGTDPTAPYVRVGGRDVSAQIRGPEVTAAVSAVSAVPQVRAEMVRRQRALLGAGGVAEGRDVATVVAPEAAAKVYLTASGDVRARRRARELAGAGVVAETVRRTRMELSRRDALDSGRVASPLTRAADAVEIDSSALDVEQVVDEVLALLPGRLR